MHATLRDALSILAAAGILLFDCYAAPAAESAEVEWKVLRRLDADSPPLDVAASSDGRMVFVLTERGTVHIFDADGGALGQIAVGAQAERIAADPEGDRLYVTRRQPKRVDVVQIDIRREIGVSGAPFKGPEKAPVVVAVFSDFQ